MSNLVAYLHGKSIRPDGSTDSHWTLQVELKEKPLRFHEQGLSYTATGYGKDIPTPHMVLFRGRWRRVYAMIYSNSGTLYLKTNKNERITVQHLGELK